MPKLPVTVTDVVLQRGGNYAVSVAYADGSTGNFLIPPNLATAGAVTISALAFAALTDVPVNGPNFPGRKHRRYDPRPA